MQSLKNFLNNQSIPIVISIMALFIAFGTQDTPCLSANVCSAGSNPEFQNDVSFKSGTINKATLSHDLSQDNQYFLGDSGSSGTSTIALITKDSSNQEKLLTINGGVTVGQSSVSEPGTLRVQTSTSPVLQIYGNAGWQDVNQSTPSPNLYNSFAGDTGSITASSSSETITFKSNDPSLTFDVQGDSVFLNSAGGGSGSSTEFANFYINSNQTFTYSGFNETSVNYDTEYIDTEDCFSTNSTGEITYDSSCNSAYYQVNIKQIINFSGLTNNGAMIQGGNYGSTSSRNQYRTWVTLFNTPNYTLGTNDIVCFDPGETWKLMFYHGQNYSTGSAIWLSGNQQSSLSFIKLQDKGSGC